MSRLEYPILNCPRAQRARGSSDYNVKMGLAWKNRYGISNVRGNFNVCTSIPKREEAEEN